MRNSNHRYFFTAILLCACWCAFAATSDNVDWEKFLARNDLTWTVAPKYWEEAPFLGNGFVGAYLYHDSKHPNWLRVELSRSDLYNRVHGQNECFRYASGHLYLKPKGTITSISYRLGLYRAEATGTITTDKGTLRFRTFVHANEPLLRFEVVGSGEEVLPECVYEAERAISTSKILNKKKIGPDDIEPEPVVTQAGDTTVAWQPFQRGGGAGTAVRVISIGETLTVDASLAVGWKDESAKDVALRSVLRAQPNDYDISLRSHADWWAQFYQASFLTIPDARLESYYWIQLYKMASATRSDAPAIDLMGPWFSPSIWCRYWWNLNVELTYWPQLTANHLELGDSLMKMIDRNQENLIKSAPAEWRHDSAFLGGMSGMDMWAPFGSYTKQIECLTFLMHNVYWQYRYSMDERLLREVLYPLLTRSLNFYRHKLVTLKDGTYHLPLGWSSEYATPAEDVNQDLSAIRWSAQVLLAAAARLKIDDPMIPVWKDLLANLAPYQVDEKTGFMIGKDVPLAESHRHWSHLFMIFPFTSLDLKGPDRALVEKSIRHYLSMTKGHAGFTYTGSTIMAAYLGDGDQALDRLNTLMTRYLRPNTMYYEACKSPCMETPLSGARGVQEMVLQSWGDTIRVFPAIPKSWAEMAFRDLRTEGAFLVTAKRKGGKTVFVRIESLAGEPCRILHGVENPTITSSRPLVPVPMSEGVVGLPLAKGDWVEFRAKDETDFNIAPVERSGPDNAWGTVKKGSAR